MPKELVAVSTQKLEWRDYQEKELEPKEVRVACRYAAPKHGTEMAFFKGYARPRGAFDRTYRIFRKEAPRTPGTFRPGNMAVGTVSEIGSEVTKVSAGDTVCLYTSIRESRTVSEDRCWKISERVSWKAAVCLDPADYALAAIRDGHVRIGDSVAVYGLGAIGLMAIQLAKMAGANPVIAVDPLANRREAAQALGADEIIDPEASDAGLTVRELTDLRGVDVAIEYSGAVSALQHAIRSVAFGGNVVAGAFPPPYGPGLDLGAEAHQNRPNLIFSRAESEPNRDHPRWNNERIFATCRKLIEEGKINGDPIVSPVVGMKEFPEAYLAIGSHPERSVKLGLAFS
jgi:threonine dehydrogenase-like Zn-dependent dehydrogenase